MSQFELFIYEDIRSGSAKAFERDIKALPAKAGDTIRLRLNSGGGNVFDGSSIYNSLRRHPAKVIVSVDGMAASAASLIAMAGDKIEISATGYIMIHNPWLTSASGAADDLRKAADDLDRLTKTFSDAYVSRSKGKLSVEKCKELMDAESWLNAQEAVSYGLADTITEPLDMAACVPLGKFGYSNVPNFAESAEPGSIRVRIRRMELIVARNEAIQRGARALTEYRDQVMRERAAAMHATVEKMAWDATVGKDGWSYGVPVADKPISEAENRAYIKQMFEDRR